MVMHLSSYETKQNCTLTRHKADIHTLIYDESDFGV